MEKVLLKIFRGLPENQHWEFFSLHIRKGMNIISALMEIQKNPITTEGLRTTPVVWESGCLEEVCGSCSMLINGIPRQACATLIENVIKESGSFTITLAPFTKFPLIRDLVVDRSSMFQGLKKIKAWAEIDGYFDRGPGPKVLPENQEIMYAISKCMTCGCCLESCPQTTKQSAFIGPAVIAQARLLSIHPTTRKLQHDRIRVLQEKGGVGSCGNAQNCQRVCPKKIPILDALADAGRETTKQALKDLFGTPERQNT